MHGNVDAARNKYALNVAIVGERVTNPHGLSLAKTLLII
jgi:hypothetical protein